RVLVEVVDDVAGDPDQQPADRADDRAARARVAAGRPPLDLDDDRELRRRLLVPRVVEVVREAAREELRRSAAAALVERVAQPQREAAVDALLEDRGGDRIGGTRVVPQVGRVGAEQRDARADRRLVRRRATAAERREARERERRRAPTEGSWIRRLHVS